MVTKALKPSIDREGRRRATRRPRRRETRDARSKRARNERRADDARGVGRSYLCASDASRKGGDDAEGRGVEEIEHQMSECAATRRGGFLVRDGWFWCSVWEGVPGTRRCRRRRRRRRWSRVCVCVCVRVRACRSFVRWGRVRDERATRALGSGSVGARALGFAGARLDSTRSCVRSTRIIIIND